MTCWKWFNSILKEAGINISDKNEAKIDAVIHQFIGKQSAYGHCSADWSKARKEIQANIQLKQELIQKLKTVA